MLEIITRTKSIFRTTNLFLISRHFSTSNCLATRQGEGGKWLHKLNDEERGFVYATRKGLRSFTFYFTFNSRQPLTPEIMFQALKHIQRKFPAYQLTIRERNGELWFFQQDNPADLDFEVLDKGSTFSKAWEDVSRPFDEVNGPLWRARFIPAKESDECPIPGIREEFPFQYYLVDSPLHAIIDGTTHITMFHTLVNILNYLQEGGEQIDPSLAGEFIDNDEYDRLYSECRQELEGNPEKMEALKKSVLATNKQPLLLRAFPPSPRREAPTTREIEDFHNTHTISKFFAKCKDKKITIGNGFQTICMTALIELAQETGLNEDSFDLSFSYNVNMRRYMKPRDKPILGYHVRKISSLFTLNRNVRDDFWSNCQMVQQKNKELLSVSPIAHDIIQKKFLPYVSPEDYVKTEPVMTRDFSYNNIGDGKFGLKRKHAVLSDVRDKFLIHQNNFPIYIQLYSLEGVLKTLMSYNTGVVTDETAHSLVKKVESLIQYYG